MGLSNNAIAIYKRLYFGENETKPSEVHKRVARFAASQEDAAGYWEMRFLLAMEDGRMRPNSPAMMNGGLLEKPVTSACFVGKMEDDLHSILEFDKTAAIVFSYGSGIGINYGKLREVDAPLSTGGRSSGPFAFMRKLAATAEAVKSGGRARRAAIMSMMYDNHPNILDFIKIKQDPNNGLNSMNLSVAISDRFMRAVKYDEDWELIGVNDHKVKQVIKAREMFDLIAECAHKTGDPGVFFIDRANRDNTVPSI
jgi:ribonucleoside-diphosphate reductase alpha chain